MSVWTILCWLISGTWTCQLLWYLSKFLAMMLETLTWPRQTPLFLVLFFWQECLCLWVWVWVFVLNCRCCLYLVSCDEAQSIWPGLDKHRCSSDSAFGMRKGTCLLGRLRIYIWMIILVKRLRTKAFFQTFTLPTQSTLPSPSLSSVWREVMLLTLGWLHRILTQEGLSS